MPYFKSKDGTKLFYKDWGSGDPVVFVHGWCFPSESWENVISELPHRGLRCIAYDQRGCGRSDQPWRGYDYDTLSYDLHTLIVELDLHKVTLVGHSMGCGVVTRYLSRYGATNCVRAVLTATTTPFLANTEDNPQGIDRQFLNAALTAMKSDRPRYVREGTPGFFGIEKTKDTISQAMIDWGVDLTLRASPQAALEMMKTNFLTDQREELKKIDIPVLIIHGNADQTSPFEITAKRTKDLLPDGHLKIYNSKAHGIIITESNQVSEDVFNFIKR